MKEKVENQNQKEVIQVSMTQQPNTKEIRVHSLMLLIAGPKRTTAKNQNKTLKSVLPNNVKTHSTYAGQKLSTRFLIKDKIIRKHKHICIYYAKCSESFCTLSR